ncbi:hypothetical protein JI664_23590, partial [Rhodobacter sp. NTK016B]|uniref:hypothetical protein n=1 Tax=Rhodobacter sp. NTK016B TaxID=2759676 RepID=UPI001ACE6972
MTDACTVSGVLYDAGGELLTETQLVFTRLGKLAALEAETAVAPVFGTGARKTVTTNATTAAFSIDLMPGSWSVTYQGVTAQETISFEVPVAASANFAVIIDQTNAEGSAIVESYAAHMASTSNPHSVTKAQVGLGDVDNTSDANKPVSTAQAEADALRLAKAQNLADLENAATARVNLGLGDVDNTSDADKPVSTAQAATFEAEALVGARQSGAGKLAPAMIKFPAARRDTYASGGGSRYQWVAAWEMGADDRIERITGYLSSEGGANT